MKHSLTLLCVDDDPDDVELFFEAARLLDSGLTCVKASNGYEALSILSSVRPDYIFLDINMPLMNGKETLMKIRQDKKMSSIPVCILSTSENPRELDQLKQIGADKCITKPKSFTELCLSISTVLNNNLKNKC
jgi:CheY-like chemotaxis protein